MFGRHPSRGASVLAALVFVAVLGIIAYAVDTLTPGQGPVAINSQALTALADNATTATTENHATSSSPQANGQCQRDLEKCKSDPNTNKLVCENTWKQCVTNKCVQINKTVKADGVLGGMCFSDSDCQQSCTAAARSTSEKAGEVGVISCCLGGPKHTNTCAVEIDGSCSPASAAAPQPPATNSIPPAQPLPGNMNPPTPSVGAVDGNTQLGQAFSSCTPGTPNYDASLCAAYNAGAPAPANANTFATDPTAGTQAGITSSCAADPTAIMCQKPVINPDLSQIYTPPGITAPVDPAIAAACGDKSSLSSCQFFLQGNSFNGTFVNPNATTFAGPAPGTPDQSAPVGLNTQQQPPPDPTNPAPPNPNPNASSATPAPGTAQPDTPRPAQQSCGILGFITGCNSSNTGNTSNASTNNSNPLSALSSLFSGSNSPLTSFLGGFLKGLVGGSLGLSGAPVGNTVPQPPGTCAPQYVCGNNTLYYRQNTCVDQPVQYCQYGCSGTNQCSTTPTNQNGVPNQYGTGTAGQACPAPQPQPDPAQCSQGTWRQTVQNGCASGWQCVPTGAVDPNNPNQNPNTPPLVQPTAQLSCAPQLADVGMTVAAGFTCQNAVHSAGAGFDTQDAQSGTASITITDPPANTNTATYKLTCINQSLTATAQCSVQVSKPSIALAVTPTTVPAGSVALVGWTTSGMKACTLSSPDSAEFTAENMNHTIVNGIATTTPVTADMRILLHCTTLGGATKDASATVKVGSVSHVSVSSSADGKSVAHGSIISVQWQAGTASSGTAAALWLYDLASQTATKLIAGALPASGSYSWTIPASGSSCSSTKVACASDLVAGHEYAIEAALYSPANADLTGEANGAVPQYSGYGYTPAQFQVSQ